MFRDRIEQVCDRISKIADKNSVIVDGGCGRNRISRILKDYNIIGFDKENKSSSFIGDITHMPIKTNSVDVFTSCEVLEHLNEKEFDRALLEIDRVLKKGGYVILTFPVECKEMRGNHEINLNPYIIWDSLPDNYYMIEKTIVYKNEKAKENKSGNYLVMIKKNG